MRPADVDRLLLAHANSNYGVISVGEAVELGVTSRQVRHRAEQGRLVPIYPKVYVVGHRWVPERGRWRAAVLSCGPSALLSHRHASALWSLERARGPIGVTVGRRTNLRRPTLQLHRSRTAEADTAVRDGIPVTSIERVLIDRCEEDPGVAGRLLEAADKQDLLRPDHLRSRIEMAGGRGTSALVRALQLYESANTQSEAERRFLEICSGSGVPSPLVNTLIAGYVVDFHWPSERLIVEIDGVLPPSWEGRVRT